ncbi:MAG: hypothetical protein IJF39_03985 [Clostridia bacterium]|nr:hypothetical protein [Clostridia bacterium]
MVEFSMKAFDGFFQAVLQLKSVEDCQKFFEDVCTIKELQSIAQRWEVAVMLNDGRNYQEISKKTGASTATISRVAKCLNYGAGGYELVLEKGAEE